MKKILQFKGFFKSAVLIAIFSFSQLSFGQIVFTPGSGLTQVQNFDGLPTNNSSNNIDVAKIGQNWYRSNSTIQTQTLSGNLILNQNTSSLSHGVYNCSTNSSLTDRAVGLSASGSGEHKLGVRLVNSSGSTINSFLINGYVEKYRNGSSTSVIERNIFEYSLNATSLDSGSWTAVSVLDLVEPDNSSTQVSSGIDGNLSVNRAFFSGSINGLSLIDNAGIWIRWRDTNDSGTDSVLALDDLSITANIGSSVPEINVTGNGIDILDGATPASVLNDTDFGIVATNVNVEKTFTIENLGAADLILTSPYVQLTLGGQGFSISQQPTLTTIPVGGSTTFKVLFNSASAGTFDDGIEVLSDDSDEANYSFDIKAVAELPTPEINIIGNTYTILSGDSTPSTTDGTDFGSGIANVSVVKTFTIENLGTGNLIVSDIIMLDGTNYSISGITLPATINPASSIDFTVTFNSSTIGVFDDSVLIDSNDSDESTYDFSVTAKTINLNFQPGDINIVSFAVDTPDSFAFVNWVDIPADAEISFTDNAFNGATLNSNEDTLVWKNDTGNSILPGTVIVINNSSVTAEIGSIVSGALSGLSASNDNLFIYENDSTNPNFIYGLTNSDWLTTGTVNTNNSYLPSSLNVVNANIVLGILDNYEYSNSRINQFNFEG